MEKVPKLSSRPEFTHKVFEFSLTGDSRKCFAILNALDLDKHGIKFLHLRDRVTPIGCSRKYLNGIIEMKEGTTLDGMKGFFRNLDLWDYISTIGTSDAFAALVNAHERNITFDDLMLEKGTLTEPNFEILLAEKRRSRWDLRHR